MTLRAVADTVWAMLDLFAGRVPAPAHRPPPAFERVRTLRNGQMLLPGITESTPWQFNPEA